MASRERNGSKVCNRNPLLILLLSALMHVKGSEEQYDIIHKNNQMKPYKRLYSS